MKVALIHYRLIHFGGLETRLKNYIQFFHNRGDEVQVICAKYNPDVVLPEGTNVEVIGAGLLPKPFRQGRFDARLGRFMQKHIFDFSLSLGRTSHQQFILCPGNHLGYLQKIGKRPTSISDFEQIRMDRRGFHHSQLIFAASQMIRKEVIDLYNVQPEKVKVLYPPLNTFRFYPPAGDERIKFRKELGWHDDSQYFLFASTGHTRKGLPLLLKLFEKLKDQKKHLVIIGYPEVKSSLSNVHYLGFIEEPRKIYVASDALMHPSMYEPYGQIVAEALQCGTPVIISDQVGASELVNEQEGIILSPTKLTDWLEAVNNFKRTDFAISTTFATDKKITLDYHMDAMLQWAGVK
ncbi:MAG: glycosyltransferase family 4 protein [Flavobacteriales bacterium]|nr:glycosyltransferase family 4 protein [Flavobacteriales bacterium]